MYINLKNESFENLKNSFNRISDVFLNFKTHNDLFIEELIEFYTNDESFLKDIGIIENSMNDIFDILGSIETLENEFTYFFAIKRIMDYLLQDVGLFIQYLSFIDNLFVNFFNLIHKRLMDDKDYQNECDQFFLFLQEQKDFFYTEIFEYDGEYEDAIIEINNVFWG